MARLTRTQKYAELREQIAQDREETLKTQELQNYENQLNKVKNQFGQETEPVLNYQQEAKPVIPEVRPQEEVKPVVETRPQEDIKQVQNDSLKSLDDILKSMMSESFDNGTNEPVKEAPVIEQKPIQEVEQPIIEPTIEQNISESIKETVEVAASFEDKKEEVTAPALNTVNNDIEDTMEVLTSEVDSLENIIYDMAPSEDKPFIVEIPEKPQVEIQKEPQVEPQIEIKAVNNDFMKSTLDEVEKYNKNTGKTTLDDLPKALVDEVIHPDRKEDDKEVAEFEDVSDDDFSNTVSLEIDKVLNEIKNQQEQIESLDTNTIILDQTVNDVVDTKPVIEEVKEVTDTMEHPVLTKTLEETEPLVIKPISEINKRDNDDFVDDTIPFNVQNVQEEDEDDEDYAVETPSKVLNVILGILIVVLIAVLGIIVYYILVAKGIIG